MYYQNTRGICTKLNEIYAASCSITADLICLAETWLHSSILNSEILTPQYTIYRQDRRFSQVGRATGGGVLTAASNDLRTHIINLGDDLLNLIPLVDFCVCKCHLGNFNFYIVTIYIPPDINNDDLDIFLSAFSLRLLGKSLIIVGDFNLHQSEFSLATDSQSTLVQSFVSTLDLRQCNTISNVNGRKLDLIFTNMNCHIDIQHDTTPLVNEDRHHPALYISISFKPPVVQPMFPTNSNQRYNFRKADIVGLYLHLSHTDWTILENHVNIDSAVETFYALLYHIINQYVPSYCPSPNKYPTWYTNELKQLIKLKEYYFRKWKKTKSDFFRSEFNRIRSSVKNKSAAALKNYLLNIEQDISGDPNKFWEFIRQKKNSSRIPGYMCDEDMDYTKPDEIVNAFASEFSRIYRTSRSLAVPQAVSHHLSFGIGPFSENEICQCIKKKVKANMMSGDDRIPAFLVNDLSSVLAYPLKLIFNLSLSCGTFPSCWKLTRISPIFKKGDSALVSNYRPVTILSNFAKVFDSLVYSEVYRNVHPYISVSQHGFMSGRSTVTNLLSITQTISETLDAGGQMDVIYTDFSRAFDTIDHRILLTKLEHLGCNPQLVKFFQSYLLNRSSYVSYNGYNSNSFITSSGVPQGSNLGPLLFNIYINDLFEELGSNVLGYADDLKIFNSAVNESECSLLQTRLEVIAHWCQRNGLCLNVAKCNVISYNRKSTPLLFPYSVDTMIIPRRTCIRDLGVTFDIKLSFSEHIMNITKSASKCLGFVIRQSREFTNISTMSVLYYAFVRSKLEYASLVWFPHYLYLNLYLEKVQKRFLKYLSFRIDGIYPPRGTDYGTLLARFNIVPLQERRETNSAKFLCALLKNQVDCQEMLNKINIYVPPRPSRCSKTFWIPRSRTNIGVKAPVTHLSKCGNLLIPDPFC